MEPAQVNPESSDKATIYDWHPGKSPLLWVMSLLSFACAVGSFLFYKNTGETGGKIFAACLGLLFVFCGVGLLLPARMAVNFARRKLTRETLFLGRVPLWRKNFQFGEFDAVVLQRKDGGDGTATYFVGLNCLSGRKLWLKYFSNVPSLYPCLEAEKIVEQLSRDLQLPVNRMR